MCRTIDSSLKDFYFCIYDLRGNFIDSIENIDMLSRIFGVLPKRVLYAIRNDDCLILDGRKVKVYPYRKFEEKEVKCR